MKSEKKKIKLPNPESVAIPRAYGTGAIFAPVPQTGPRTVMLKDAAWTIGIRAPHGGSPKYEKAFDINHAKVIFAILGLYHSNLSDYNMRFDINYNTLLEAAGMVRSAHRLKLLKEILGDLENTWTAIRTPENKVQRFRVLGSVSVETDAAGKDTLKYIMFDPTFLKILENYEEYFGFRLDVWNKLKSPIAKAIYIFLPSRALHHRDEKSPFKITLTNLLQQINVNVPIHKSVRKKIFCQNANPIIDQLNGVQIHQNKTMMVRLEETVDRSDYNLCAWVVETAYRDRVIGFNPNSSIFEWWLASGRAPDEFKKRILEGGELDAYQIETLEGCKINVKKNMRFLQMSMALIGRDRFSELCGDLSMRVADDAIKVPFAYLTTMIKNEISEGVFQPLLI